MIESDTYQMMSIHEDGTRYLIQVKNTEDAQGFGGLAVLVDVDRQLFSRIRPQESFIKHGGWSPYTLTDDEFDSWVRSFDFLKNADPVI